MSWTSWVYDTEIETLVQNSVLPEISDVIGDMSPTMKLLMNDGRIDVLNVSKPSAKHGFIEGGKYIEKLLHIENLTARGSHKGHELVNVVPNRTKDVCKQEFGRYYASISVSKDEAAAIRGSNTRRKVELIRGKTMDAHATIADMIATGIFNYDSLMVAGNEQFHGINGLGQLCGRRAGGSVYGGETRAWMNVTSTAADTWWDCGYLDSTQHTLANQLDSTSTSYLPKLFGNLVNGCTVGTYRPTVIVTTEAIFNTYETIVRALQQIPQSVEGDLGFQFLKFRGIPVIHDPYCPAEHVYGLNLKPAFGSNPTLGIKGRKDHWYTMAGWVRPANQLVDVNTLTVDLNMWCDNPRLHGALVRVEES